MAKLGMIRPVNASVQKNSKNALQDFTMTTSTLAGIEDRILKLSGFKGLLSFLCSCVAYSRNAPLRPASHEGVIILAVTCVLLFALAGFLLYR